MIEDYLEETALLYEKEEMKNNKIAIRVNIIFKYIKIIYIIISNYF